MPDHDQLQERIAAIGAEMVGCQSNCEGISRNQRDGILPRCLILEKAVGSKDDGCIACGINPSPAEHEETDFYTNNGASYDSLLKFWEERGLKKHKYYENLRRAIRCLGISGNILWTDIAKCQNKSKTERLSLRDHPQTLRRCASTFLRREIDACPKEWPLIAAGKDAFIALLYMFPSRRLIGLPHPTGSYGHFARLFGANRQFKPDVKEEFDRYLGFEQNAAFWLTAD